jgi:hypothetical protein
MKPTRKFCGTCKKVTLHKWEPIAYRPGFSVEFCTKHNKEKES